MARWSEKHGCPLPHSAELSMTYIRVDASRSLNPCSLKSIKVNVIKEIKNY